MALKILDCYRLTTEEDKLLWREVLREFLDVDTEDKSKIRLDEILRKSEGEYVERGS